MIARAARIALLGLFLVLVFSLSTIAAYSLPNALVASHLQSSLEQLQLEDSGFVSRVGLLSLFQDDYTDSIMLNEALPPPGTGALDGAFGNYVRMLKNPEGDWMPLASLKAIQQGKSPERISYARYWHGYLVFLRPLLVFLDFRALRWLNAVVFACCTLAVAVLLRYRFNLMTAIAFLMALEVSGMAAVPMSMQYSSVFYVALAGIAAVLVRLEDDGTLPLDQELFFVIGALTSFFDLLTAPILTLGMPLAVLSLGRIYSCSDDDYPLIRQFRSSVAVSSAWAAGYLGCWLGKWTLSSYVLKINVLEDAAQNIAYRINGTETASHFSRIETLERNLAMLFPLFGCAQPQGIQWDVVAAACVLPGTAVLIALLVVVRHFRRDGRHRQLLGLLPAAALPFVWYLLVNNHSRIHFFFTYRGLCVTAFTTLAAVFFCIDPDYLAQLRNKLRYHLQPASSRSEKAK